MRSGVKRSLFVSTTEAAQLQVVEVKQELTGALSAPTYFCRAVARRVSAIGSFRRRRQL